MFSIITLSVGCSQKKDDKEQSSKEETQSVNKNQVSKASNNTKTSNRAGQAQRPPVSIPAPDFTLATTEGDLVSLSDLKGKVVLLNFWGTWCGPCRIELPDFVKLYDKYNKKGLEIVGITIRRGESIEDVAKFQEQWGLNYLLLNDINGNEVSEVTMDYSRAIGQMISGIPTTLIINREGFIVSGFVGPRKEQVFYNAIKPYL
jgi:Peroxiredoxin|tara:strand:- start:1089 stop:1697 length:609 start_codon:yes stop_codon:yes gene_type:complete